MKILIASDLHWPVINGVATFSRNLARGLADRGHEVVVIAPSQDGKKSVEKDGNYTIYRTRSVVFPFYQNFRISLTPQREVHKIISDFQPDIVHIQMLMWIGQAAMSQARKVGIPVVSTSHAMPENLMDNLSKLAPLAKPINYMLKEYGRRFHSRSDVITSPTASGIEVFGKHAEKITAPIRVISNGIDLCRFTNEAPEKSIYTNYSLPKDKKIISYVGRLDAEKHVWVLIKAFKTLLDSGHDYHLLVVGAGVDVPNLKALVHELSIEEKVTFTGRVSDEDLVELHKVGDVFCVPSPAELQCIAALEAMASGKPMVAVDAGALGELCQHGKNGYLFELDDYKTAAQHLQNILADDQLRKEFSKQSLTIARTHDIAYTLDQFTELYEEVIKSKTPKEPRSIKKLIAPLRK